MKKSLTEQLLQLQKIANETSVPNGSGIDALGLAIAIKAYNLGWQDVYDNSKIEYDYQYPYINTDEVPDLITL